MDPDVRSRVLRDGRARVIVEMRLPGGDHVPEGVLPVHAADLQRRDIAAVGGVLAARLAGRSHRILHRYETVPFVALDAGADALAELEASSFWVKRVIADHVRAPSLPDSVPLVGADQAWNRGFDGTGIVVAILDTGVEASHPFLTGKVVEEACYSSTVSGTSTSVCPNGQTGQVGPGAGVSCSVNGCWHGTHVAGIAAGRGAGAGVGFSGVARGAQIAAIQVFSQFTRSEDCGGSPPCALAWDSDVIAGLERVYALRSVRTFSSVNLSLGGGSSSAPCDAEAYKPIIDNLRSVGIATVAAAGNAGNTSALSAPACVSSAISVGATTKTDTIASYSNVAPFLSLLAPGSSILSSIAGGGFGYASGTSMATPHVTGAWAVLKQAAPAATVDQILAALQATGVPITDTRSGLVTKPRIRVDQALSLLMPVVRVTSITPATGALGTTIAATITGSGFASGATVSVGGGITVTNVSVLSANQLTATLVIGSGAALGARDVIVTDPGGASGTLGGAFAVTAGGASGATLTLVYNGKLRDRVGQGNLALAADGALDGTLTATLNAGGGRTITGLTLQSNAPGTWDTEAGTVYWVLGVAPSLDGALLNSSSTMRVNFAVADGGSFVVFASDLNGSEFVPGNALTLTVTFADGSSLTASTTVGSGGGGTPTLTLTYNGKLRDRVGQSTLALAPDGALDGTLTATLNASGGRTVTGLTLQSSAPGTWDTDGGTGYWVLAVAATLDGTLLNNSSTMAVNFPVPNGGSFVVFASDFGDREFVAGTTLTLTATFSDGSSATATTTAGPSGGDAATLTMVYNGKLRDRVGQSNLALGADGALDGTLTVTLNGSGPRTVTRLTLQSSAPGTWDTDGGSGFWVLGVAPTLDGALLNDSSTMAVSFALGMGASFVVFASDLNGTEFVAGTTLKLTAAFSDGSNATATTTVGGGSGAPQLTLIYNGKLRDRVGQSSLALAPDGALDGTLTVTLAAAGGRTVTALTLQSSAPGTWDTDGGTEYWILAVASTLDGPALNDRSTMAVNFTVADGGSFVLFASDWAAQEFVSGRTLTLTATFADGSKATAATNVP